MSLTRSQIEILSKPFDKNTLGFKIQATNREKTKALLVPYLQHTDVYGRLEEVDPAWHCETIALFREQNDKEPGSYFCRMKLTVLGISRENVGEGDDPKGAYSDALKRAAVLFGIGRYLYDSNPVWVPYNEQNDKYRRWTHADYSQYDRNNDKLPISPPGEAKAKEVLTHTPAPSVSPSLADEPLQSEWPMIKQLLPVALKKLAALKGTFTPEELFADMMNTQNAKLEHIEKASTHRQMTRLAAVLKECESALKEEKK